VRWKSPTRVERLHRTDRWKPSVFLSLCSPTSQAAAGQRAVPAPMPGGCGAVPTHPSARRAPLSWEVPVGASAAPCAPAIAYPEPGWMRCGLERRADLLACRESLGRELVMASKGVGFAPRGVWCARAPQRCLWAAGSSGWEPRLGLAGLSADGGRSPV